MITFTLSQSVWEFVKLRAIRAMRLVWSMCPCVNLPMCQKRANFSFLRANVPKNVPTCQRCTSYSTWCANVLRANQSFNYFSKEFFNLWIFQLCSTIANFKNIWAILENLSRETKLKFWHLQNFIKEKKPYQSKSFDYFESSTWDKPNNYRLV